MHYISLEVRKIRKVFVHEGFYKSVPREKRVKVQKLCEKIEQQLRNSDTGIHGTSIESQSRKFHNKKALFKFRASDGDRIMFTYTTHLANYREEYEAGIYLIEYISQHDQQGRKAQNYDENIARNLDYSGHFDSLKLELEEVEQDEWEKYNDYLDLDKTVVYIKSEEELLRLFESESDASEVYISKQQFEYAKDDKASILMGGAGSGKTLVSLHKLNNYKNSEGRVGYFTHSKGLKKKSEKIFSKISDKDNTTEFFTVIDYCLSELGIKEKQFIDFVWFDKNFKNIAGSMTLPKGVNKIDIWSEIRGIIKGYMFKNWKRIYPISFKKIKQISRDILENKYKYIEQYNDDPRKIICSNSSIDCLNRTVDKLNRDQNFTDNEKKVIFEDLKKIYEMSRHFQYGKNDENRDLRLLPLGEYLNLKDEVSIYSEDERRVLHKICIKYQQYIDKEKLYDDNDLAGLTIVKKNQQEEEGFAFIAVDEAQDLTELQLYLIYNLARDKDKILFAGDIHQIINPTYFSNSRLEKLFAVNNEKIYERYLTKNYRSQKNIVKLANKLGEVRRRCIAKTNVENEQLEEAINEEQSLFYLNKDQSNLKQILLDINEKANAATIVCDDEDREYLRSIMNVKANNIYTVSEIKGLEFDYIFCYNLVGKYNDYWNEILEGKARKNAKYRYYFNVFYVAITRARKHLCLYNETPNKLLRKEIVDLFENIKEYDQERLHLTLNVNEREEWEKRGLELEESENFEKAILAYEKADLNINDITRCRAKIRAKEKDYDGAIHMMLKIEEYEYAKEYSEIIDNKEMLVLCSMLSDDKDHKKIEEEYGKTFVNEVLAKNILNEDFMKQINFNYIENYVHLNMLVDIDKIGKSIQKMKGV